MSYHLNTTVSCSTTTSAPSRLTEETESSMKVQGLGATWWLIQEVFMHSLKESSGKAMVGLGKKKKKKNYWPNSMCKYVLQQMFKSSLNITCVLSSSVYRRVQPGSAATAFGCKSVQHWGTESFKVSGHQRGWKACSSLMIFTTKTWFYGGFRIRS